MGVYDFSTVKDSSIHGINTIMRTDPKSIPYTDNVDQKVLFQNSKEKKTVKILFILNVLLYCRLYGFGLNNKVLGLCVLI